VEYLENLSGKTIAVVGLGYVGTHLLDFLKSAQEKLDIKISGVNRQNLGLLAEESFDYVFNCAGNLNGDFSQKPLKTVESNIDLNVFLLEKCRIKEALVCLSSTRIYGFTADADKVFDEDYSASEHHHLAPEALHDNAKKLMECMLINTPRDYRKVIARLSIVYGDFRLRDLDDSIFLKLMMRHKYENKKLFVKQNLDSPKDHIFIKDAVEGILRCGTLTESDDVFNICSGKSYSPNDWAKFLDAEIEQVAEVPTLYSKLSNEKAKAKIGFVGKYEMENLSLADVIKYE
jgi:nucleoside-diphosphate-sugar epimerase